MIFLFEHILEKKLIIINLINFFFHFNHNICIFSLITYSYKFKRLSEESFLCNKFYIQLNGRYLNLILLNSQSNKALIIELIV